MKAPFLVSLLGIMLVATAMPAPATEIPLSLSRDRVVVSGDTVRLGDIFTNTGAREDAPVMAAPPAGAEKTLKVEKLLDIARRHNLYWKARSWDETVTLTRAMRRIGEPEIKAALRRALEKRHFAPGEQWEVEAATRGLSLTVAEDRADDLTLEHLNFTEQTGRFRAILGFGTGQQPRLTVVGRAYRIVDIPVLNRRVPTGEIIGPDDIVWMSMRHDRVNRNIITDPDLLIGRTPHRAAVADTPLRSGDVRPPRLVNKGETVTMSLRSARMVLTARGISLDHGAMGEVIRIRNSQSRNIIEAEVTGTAAVTVASPFAMSVQSPAARSGQPTAPLATQTAARR